MIPSWLVGWFGGVAFEAALSYVAPVHPVSVVLDTLAALVMLVGFVVGRRG